MINFIPPWNHQKTLGFGWFQREAATEAATNSSFGKIGFLKSQKPATLLKINLFTYVLQGLFLDFKSFAAYFKTFQNTFYDCLCLCEKCYFEITETIVKDVLLRNNLESNVKIKNSSLFIVQLFMGTNYSFKIREITVYIYPFKTKWYKNENYFFFESDYKSYFYTKNKITVW